MLDDNGSLEVARIQGGDLSQPAMTVEQALVRYKQFGRFVKGILREGVDYGTIPGIARPTLFKPGAEKLCTFAGFRPEFEHVKEVEQWDGPSPFFYYLIKVRLWKGNFLAGEGEGSCNSRESKYGWRWVSEDAIPPGLDKASLVSRSGAISEFEFAIGKAETTGPYAKSAEYWERFAKAIEDGTATRVKKKTKAGKELPAWAIGGAAYRIPNPEIFDQINTILKMAQKRALIAAVLVATAASEFFTQDLEDFADVGTVASEPEKEAAPPPAATTNGQAKPFDFGAMVELFVELRKRLAVQFGTKRANEAYYAILGTYGVEHSNEFRKADSARSAYKALKEWAKDNAPDEEERKATDGEPQTVAKIAEQHEAQFKNI